MILSVEEFRQYVKTDELDAMLEAKLQALESSIRAYTNNNFQKQGFRVTAHIVGNSFMCSGAIPFSVGDTVQVSESVMNEGLYTIVEVGEKSFTVAEETMDESAVLVTKVAYPMDVKMGAVNLMKWDLENRDKVGIASETISRHSVTYFDMSADNSSLGYPKALTGFLKPYMKARF